MNHNMSADICLLKYEIYSRRIDNMKMAVGLGAIIFIVILSIAIPVSRTSSLEDVAAENSAKTAQLEEMIEYPNLPAFPFSGCAGIGMGIVSGAGKTPYKKPDPKPLLLRTDSKVVPVIPEVNLEEVVSVITWEITEETTDTIIHPGNVEGTENEDTLPVITPEAPADENDIPEEFIFDTSIRNHIPVYDTFYSFQITFPEGTEVTDCRVCVNGIETGTLKDGMWSGELLPNQENEISILVNYRGENGELLSAESTYFIPTVIAPLELKTDLKEPDDGLYTKEKYKFYAYAARGDREYMVEVYVRGKLLLPEADGKTYAARMIDGENNIKIRMLWNGELVEEREVTILCWVMPEAEGIFSSPLGEGTVYCPEYMFSYYVVNTDTGEEVPSKVYLNNEELVCCEDGMYHVTLKPGSNTIRINWYDSDGEAVSESKGVTYLPQ